MKIAFCIPIDLNYHGGVEKHVLRLADALREIGADVDVYAKRPSQGNAPESNGLPRDSSEQFYALESFNPAHYSIIHTHAAFYTPQFFAMQLHRPTGQRYVHTLHSVSLDYLFNCRAWLNWRCYYCSLIEAMWSQYADRVIAVSQTTKNWATRYYGIPSEKVTVIHNGHTPIPLPPETRQVTRAKLGLNENDLAILFVGRGEDRVKGTQTIIESMAALTPKFPNLKLLAMPGTGFSDAPWLIPTGQITHKETPAYYTAADIFVNASMSEGFPLTIAEALATPLPIIASPVGAIPDVITHNHNGLLLNSNRTNMTGLLTDLINSPSLREKLSQNAGTTARSLTWGHIAKETLEVYKSLMP